MKKPFALLTAALLSGAAVDASAVSSFSLNFDSRPSGTAAQSYAPIGLTITYGQFINRTDEFGDEIPNTGYWASDSGTVLATNPMLNNYGAAPSGSNALNVLDQPVLFNFDTPFNLTSFSAALDNSTFGNPGASSILFYDAADTLLGQIDFDQTTPGAIVASASAINGVSKIVLPTTAFYDNVTVVPEPATVGFVAFALGAFFFVYCSKRKRIA